MKNRINTLATVVGILASTAGFAQNTITGRVLNSTTNEPIGETEIRIQNTDTYTMANTDGSFTITTTLENGRLNFDAFGYNRYTKGFVFINDNHIDLGTIYLDENSENLDELVIIAQGVIDVAEGRKTPIAVSTVKREEIEEKVGSGDITTVLQNTPSVYVASQASGFGDSQMYTRGFDQSNTAFLLNGQPINGMEDGKMYWSNWSGMSDIANAIQIQRGLGSSKLAISSVGGTINFITKATEMQKGGYIKGLVGNDNFYKSTIAYSTGLLDNGWGATALFTHWQGDGYNDMTQGQGQNYFLSIGYKANENHNFNFLVTGAPQWHNQNFSKKISDYLTYGYKYNNNWGYLNGEQITERKNYYHKPIINLNWDWNINDVSSLSTVLYASIGRGGGTGRIGKGIGMDKNNGQKDFQAAYDANVAAGGEAISALRASVNNHFWYGLVTNYNHKLTEELSLNVGADLRSYSGDHFRQIVDFLGATSFKDTNKSRVQTPNAVITNSYPTSPWAALSNFAKSHEDRVAYDYSETIRYGGLFSQLEYATDDFSAFFQGSISNQSHQRYDYYQYTKENEAAEKVTNFGYNVKAGASYTINDNHMVFANAGVYSRQPFHDNIYLNYGNDINPFTENEDIVGLELGYKFNSRYFSFNLNAYKTTWANRVETSSRTLDANNPYNLAQGSLVYTVNQGVKQDHKGVELDFRAFPVYGLEVRGFASIGDWKYVGNSIEEVRSEDRKVLEKKENDLDGGKVGGAAQTTFGLGLKYKITNQFSVDADFRHFNQLYANVQEKENLLLPSYSLVDAGISYGFFLSGNNKLSFRLNVNNVFDTTYISQIDRAVKVDDKTEETYEGLDVRNQVYFGYGRTWNISAKFTF